MGLFRKKADDDTDQPLLSDELSVLAGVLSHYPAGTQLNFGAPSRCPECGNFGFVQNVNYEAGNCTTSCLSCHITWTITRRALGSQTTAVAPAPRVVPAPTMGTEFSPDLAVPSLNPLAIGEPVVVEPVVVAAPIAAATPTVVAPVPTPTPPTIDLDRTALQVLIVEDNAFDLATLETLLEPFGPDEIRVMTAATRAEGQQLARAGRFDIVVLDLDLPDSSGITTVLEWQHAVTIVLPLIATAAEAGAELIQQARALGVVHVVQKSHLDQLAAKGETGSRQLLKLLRTTATRPASPSPVRSVHPLRLTGTG
jgi:CheY-like chemotaxis protein